MRSIIHGLCVLVAGVGPVVARAADDSIVPTDSAGRTLNLGFEDGTLKDWTASGDAFDGQPVKGDAVAPRRPGMKSQHAGDYWVGTYERGQDKPKGTLTSVPFKVTKPWASFLVGGGANVEQERVEVVRAADQKVIFRAAGQDKENMRRVAVDLTQEVGKEVFIRVVDQGSGGWGHVNFDDFRLHDQKPAAAAEKAAPAQLLTADVVKNAGLSPEQAVKEMTLPPGFKATVFAAEPDVVQPVGFAIDDRGRLWVAEAMNYPKKAPEGQGKDRILILEDTDGDGRFDKRTVFYEGLNLVSGIEVGFGGVWVGQAPQLLFIPILEGDKAGKPEVLLDGWGYQDTHETLNAFNWGPDGWLYGCQGVFTHSKVGKPGAPDSERTLLNACVWRYHPTKHTFEIFAEGASNQWGVDWNDQGQAFITACVIPHLYHVIQGGRYQRQAGQHFEPYTFDDIKTIADHRHWAGGGSPHSGNGKSDSAGGGHAHAGAMIYLGDNWPAEYRNTLFMSNIHGNRANNDLLEHVGSGYVGHHGKDFLLMNDRWSRLINFKYGPDGGVYCIDWYDQQACHLPKEEVWDRSNGRIYKITYGDVKPVKVDLAAQSNADLLKLQLSKNDWYVRHARRVLQERAAKRAGDVLTDLKAMHMPPPATPELKLRSMWLGHAIGLSEEDSLSVWLKDDSEFVRAWGIQLVAEGRQVSSGTLEQLAEAARLDPSPVVRLYLASAMGRLPAEQRWGVMTALLAHAPDATDHNLPLMYWYAIEPAVPTDVARAARLAGDAKIPLVREFIARRLALMSDQPAALAAVVRTLGESAGDDVRRDLLKGVTDGLAGKRSVPMPEGWHAVYDKLAASADAGVKQQAQALATVFGDPRALAALRAKAADANLDAAARQNALDTLLAAKDAQTLPILQSLVTDAKLRGTAIRGLAAYDDPRTPDLLLAHYAGFDQPGKLAALNTLASRVAWAEALIAAIEANKVAKADLTSPTVRSLAGLDSAPVNAWIAKNWGTVRATAAEKTQEVAKYKQLLAPQKLAQGDASAGRAVFARTCMQCHTLFDAGAKIGPDLTGSNRANVDYLLENIIDPSAVIGKDYLMTTVRTKDGRVIDGIIKSESAEAITLATVNEQITLPKAEVKSSKTSNVSMMPEGLLAGLSDREVRDLIKYLGSAAQVPMLADEKNAGVFFNGKDLTGWDGDPSLWHVENGELVGKTTAGLKRNNFIFSQLVLADFRLVCQVKLTPNKANSGIQFRSVPFGEGEAKGYQADAGAGWWGKLYEESGRGLIAKEGGERYLKPDEWNTYEVLAVGDHVRLAINGHVCADVHDPDGPRKGQTALQIHSGGPTEVRYKDFHLELQPKDEMKTAK